MNRVILEKCLYTVATFIMICERCLPFRGSNEVIGSGNNCNQSGILLDMISVCIAVCNTYYYHSRAKLSYHFLIVDKIKTVACNDMQFCMFCLEQLQKQITEIKINLIVLKAFTAILLKNTKNCFPYQKMIFKTFCVCV